MIKPRLLREVIKLRRKQTGQLVQMVLGFLVFLLLLGGMQWLLYHNIITTTHLDYEAIRRIRFAFTILFTVLTLLLAALFVMLGQASLRALYRDGLTGLYNHDIYLDIIANRLKDGGEGSALYVVNLDGFRQVNGTLGYTAGDRLLRAVARRLVNMASADAVLARVTSDEFVVYEQGFGSEAEANEFGNKLAAVVAQTEIEYNGVKASAVASVGGAVWQDDTAQQLADRATQAMYQAKGEGRGQFRMYDRLARWRSELDQKVSEEIAAILAENRFRHVFQPIVDLRTAAIVGYEGFTRLFEGDETAGQLSTFLRTAGQSAEIQRRLTQSLANRFKVFGREGLFLSVNESDEDMYADLDSEQYRSCLAAFVGLDMVIELNEVCKPDVAFLIRKAARARQAGQRIALDDFAFGQLSAMLLVALNPEIIKLSPDVVHGIDSSPSAQNFVELAAKFAHNIGSVLIAVGVETPQELETLAHLGVDMVQGYLLGKPSQEPQDISEEARAMIKQYGSVGGN